MRFRLLQLAALAVLFTGVTTAPNFLWTLPLSLVVAVLLLKSAGSSRRAVRTEALSGEIASFLKGEPEPRITRKSSSAHYSLRERMQLESARGEEGDSWFFEKFK